MSSDRLFPESVEPLAETQQRIAELEAELSKLLTLRDCADWMQLRGYADSAIVNMFLHPERERSRRALAAYQLAKERDR